MTLFLHNFILYTVVVLGFLSSRTTVFDEGQVIELEVELIHGSLDRTVLLEFTTSEGSARG